MRTGYTGRPGFSILLSPRSRVKPLSSEPELNAIMRRSYRRLLG